MLCKAFDKEAPCTAEATFTVFWPGQETVSCDRHHAHQQRIAGFMGFSLSSRPLIETQKYCDQTREDNSPCRMPLPCPRHTVGQLNTGQAQ